MRERMVGVSCHTVYLGCAHVEDAWIEALYLEMRLT